MIAAGMIPLAIIFAAAMLAAAVRRRKRRLPGSSIGNKIFADSNRRSVIHKKVGSTLLA